MNNKTLRKSRDSVISRVCAGIAEYFGWQPGDVRAAFVIIGFLGGSSLIAYAILHFVMPPPNN
ncbi:PspC domain-containing protein [Maribacter litoralis]|uniref:PspC domain-containing protein n=1 Tax=Maribacter litoralis TaxID=2059726 RepID=UPI003D2AE5F0